MEKITLNVNMHCDGCVKRISKALSEIKEVRKYDISLKKQQLSLELENIDFLDKIISVIEDLGFEVSK